MVLRYLGLEKATPVETPVAKRPNEEPLLLAGATPLNAEDTTLHRSLTMRVNNLSLFRPDLSFAAGCLAEGMKSPTTKDLEELKRVWRYLRDAIGWSDRVHEPGVWEVFCDADHAGDWGTEHRSVEQWRV